MPRYALTVSYDGTDFCGWQKQEPPAHANVHADKTIASSPSVEAAGAPVEPAAPDRLILRTVQEVLERAVRDAVREPVVLMGASRTDSGVHAKGQCAAFTCTDTGWPLERGVEPLRRAVNARLPDDVLVTAARAVPIGFDPIGDCIAKGYSYTIHVSRDRAMWDRRLVHHVWHDADVDRMNAVAAELVGEHDFAAFAAAGHGRLSTIRRVLSCSVMRTPLQAPDPIPARLRIDISGTGFLWNMVRIIAGTLLEAGWGKIDADRVRRALATGDRRLAGPTLPARGLCLEWINYPTPADPAKTP